MLTMDDRFKFRVWDKTYKRFYYFQFDECGKRDSFNPNEPIGELDEWKQCTGLKDKNGKLIYEGDVLLVDWMDKRYEPHNIAPVEWDDEAACWNLGEGGSPRHDASSYMEVIGNIWENPELLNPTTK